MKFDLVIQVPIRLRVPGKIRRINMWQWLHKGLSLDEKVILLKRTHADSWDDYKESYGSIKTRPLDINTKGQFPNVV